MLQDELERLGASSDGGAYRYAVIAHAARLATAVGIELDAHRLRHLRLQAWQQVVRQARSPDAGVAADLLGARDGLSDDEQTLAMRSRLVRALIAGQRGDVTWARQANASLQQVLVQTAVAARVVQEVAEAAAAVACPPNPHLARGAKAAAV